MWRLCMKLEFWGDFFWPIYAEHVCVCVHIHVCRGRCMFAESHDRTTSKSQQVQADTFLHVQYFDSIPYNKLPVCETFTRLVSSALLSRDKCTDIVSRTMSKLL